MIQKRGSGDFHKIYRPWTVSEIYGQENAVKFVRNGIAKGTIPKVLLFHGASGCGKTTLARIIGLALNCEQGPTVDPCFQCSACKSVHNGRLLAHVEINAADLTGVDDMREIRGQFSSAPFDGRQQVFVFDECHRLSKNAQEMLLKEVEDNHAQNQFIFCSTNPDQILDTLKNRCVPIEIGAVDDKEIRRLLNDVCRSERIINGRDVLTAIAKESGGLARNALQLLERAIHQEKLVAHQGEIVDIVPEQFSNILLVAPHAVPNDDDSTGDIARKMSEVLGAHAVINEKYQKPETLGCNGPDIDRLLVNLNRWDQISDYPKIIGDFISPLISHRDKIKIKHQNALIIHLHGISNDNLCRVAKAVGTLEADILIGFGQAKGASRSVRSSRLTANRVTVRKLIAALNREGVIAAESPVEPVVGFDGKPKLYCGSDQNGLNQRLCPPRSGSQSVQLEIKYSGFRDSEANVAATAQKIARALSVVAEGVVKVTPARIEDVVSPVVKTDVPGAESAPVASPVKERQPDTKLVDQTYSRLLDIFSGYFERAMMEAGSLIVDTFFGGDIERARNNDSPYPLSLNSLFERLKQDKIPGGPSRSWLYNSVKLVVAEHDFRDVHTYRQLGLSQKVLLFPVRDVQIKKRLIEESVTNGYTVVKLKERIAELNKKEVSAGENPLQLIKNPDNLFNPDYEFWKPGQLAKLPPKKKDTLYGRVRGKIRETAALIAAHYSYLDKYESLARTIKQSKKMPDEQKNISGTREWATETVNICTGCSNNCRYCYACADALKRKQVGGRDEWAICRVRSHDVLTKHPKYPGTVMFPSTHDILPENIYACLMVLDNLLRAGNRVLIVSKPRTAMVELMCKYLAPYKENILFRFTIGAVDNELLRFWEPNAPLYEERKEALEYAFVRKFATSVSVEPMLDADHIDQLVDDLMPSVTDAIWIGKMKNIKSRVDVDSAEMEKAVQRIETGQSDENIQSIYSRHKDNPKIKWKESIKKVVGIERPKEAGLDV